MIECSERELCDKVRASDAFAVFLYTPLCGTCKVAARMIGIVMEMLPSLSVVRANVNFMPGLAASWRIESVPCLLIVKQGQVCDKLYAFRSVDNVYRFLRPLQDR